MPNKASPLGTNGTKGQYEENGHQCGAAALSTSDTSRTLPGRNTSTPSVLVASEKRPDGKTAPDGPHGHSPDFVLSSRLSLGVSNENGPRVCPGHWEEVEVRGALARITHWWGSFCSLVSTVVQLGVGLECRHRVATHLEGLGLTSTKAAELAGLPTASPTTPNPRPRPPRRG